MTNALTLEHIMGKHSLEDETSAEEHAEKSPFFSQIQTLPIDEQT